MSKQTPSIDVLILAPINLEIRAAYALLSQAEALPPNIAEGKRGLIGRLSAWVVRMGKGTDEATARTVALFSYCSPKMVLIIGIAGGLSHRKWKRGDVVLSESIVNLSRGKITDGSLIRRTDNDWFMPVTLRQPFERMITESQHLWRGHPQPKILGEPNMRSRRVALGNIGVTDQVIDDFTSEIGRTYLKNFPELDAVDMESTAIAAAQAEIANKNLYKPQFWLAIRGISDLPKLPVELTQDKVEPSHSGSDQRAEATSTAAQAACEVARCLIPAIHYLLDQLEVSSQPEIAQQFIRSWFEGFGPQAILAERTANNKQTKQHLDGLFSLICLDSSSNSGFVFGDLVKSLKVADTYGAIVLKGPPGTGKSSLLWHLYSYLKAELNDEKICPLYVDLKHCFLASHPADLHQLREKIVERFSVFLDSVEREQATPVIFIDGLHEHANLFGRIELELMKRTAAKKWTVFGIAEKNQMFPQKQNLLNGSKLLPTVRELTIKPIPTTDQAKALQFINLLVSLREVEGPPQANLPTAEQILRSMMAVGIEQVDFFITSLFLDYNTSDQRRSFAEILSLYSENYFSGKRLSNPKSDVARSAEIAFKQLMSGVDGIESEEGLTDHWLFANKHEYLTSYLIAYHVIRLVSEVTKMQRTSDREKAICTIGFVYPETINKFAKELVNADAETEQQILETAEFAFNSTLSETVAKSFSVTGQPTGKKSAKVAFDIAKIHLCYLAGRIKRTSRSFEKARTFLQAAKAQIMPTHAAFAGLSHLIDPEHPVEPKSNNKKRGNKLFQWSPNYSDFLMLTRTIYISLAYMGDREAATDYIEMLLDRPDWKTLNNGFHLEYYGDIRYVPKNHMLHSDDMRPCPLTLAKLSTRIMRQKTENDIALLEIESFTYFSLIQARLGTPALSPEVEQQALELFMYLKSSGLNISERVMLFAELVSSHMAKRSFTSFGLMANFFDLKSIKRRGWLSRKVDLSDCESVADHSLLACQMALFLLEDPLPKKAKAIKTVHTRKVNYRKMDIIMMLLVHDLAEVEIGDILPTESPKKEQEAQFYERLRLFDAFNGFNGGKSALTYWDRFENGNDLSARIAREIDKLECIAQLYRYKKNISNAEFEKMLRSLSATIRTEIGTEILKSITGHFVSE